MEKEKSRSIFDRFFKIVVIFNFIAIAFVGCYLIEILHHDKTWVEKTEGVVVSSSVEAAAYPNQRVYLDIQTADGSKVRKSFVANNSIAYTFSNLLVGQQVEVVYQVTYDEIFLLPDETWISFVSLTVKESDGELERESADESECDEIKDSE